ncbi:putative glucose-fructose oxidoreductase [Corynebacterium humireducens NBRC 106098 = DSM 45392]|uniref:Putative glucose-fructose oxidoreductase n=1 Tax=Corynebacterium humireducens NBRC 106098 = DSM 45392 TaxID=1223515 RepID=A0A0B5D2A9_9CORY|nr:Gfo/Idh/MocA family oxidoreductase [Corynebacterium humireducens]AJE33005.1 putative glucose-fructose oxidoreductase [Corynebacterium humireducens NBRC 106098 = DSM 45392]
MSTHAYDSPVRFAVVGVGQITQQAFLPALRSLDDVELVAAVTGSPEKAAALGDDVRVYDYEYYDQMLADGSVDAVYVATPVFRHREFAEPALRAGVHVLLEKPMATSVEDCEAMIAASESGGATLMVAYRMHQDAYMLELVDRVARGEIGETRSFTSVFTHDINEDNHRGHSGFWGGPVPDFGAYPLNLARHLFRAEPVRVHALGTRNDDRDFNFRDTVGVTLRFPDDRIAQYTLSYAADDVDNFTLVGAEGSMTSDSCYGYAPEPPRNVTVTTESGTKTRTAESMDQFAGEIRYFVDCLRSGTRPEPDGEEGLADVRVFAAVEESLRTGAEVILPPRSFGPGLSRDQVRAIPPRPAHEIPDDDELIDQEPQDR